MQDQYFNAETGTLGELEKELVDAMIEQTKEVSAVLEAFVSVWKEVRLSLQHTVDLAGLRIAAEQLIAEGWTPWVARIRARWLQKEEPEEVVKLIRRFKERMQE